MAKIKKKRTKSKSMSYYEKAMKYFSVLTEAHLVEMEYLLQNGSTRPEVHLWLQEKGYFPTITSRSMERNITLYNKYVLKPKVLASIDNVDIYKELMALKEKIDSVREYSVIVLQQKERLNRMIEVEKSIKNMDDGSLSKTGREMAYQVRSEIKLMGDLLEKLANIQMKTGILRVAPKYISGELIKDENDPMKIMFHLKEDFMDNLDAIEHELIDVVDLEEMRKDGKKD